jgi:hypothetical protein
MPDSGALELPRQTRGTGGGSVSVRYLPTANSGSGSVESTEVPLARWLESPAAMELYARVIADAPLGRIQVALDSLTAIRNSLEAHAELLLTGFERFSADGWDGDDAKRIESNTLLAARDLLREIGGAAGFPEVVPGADGSICMEWMSPGNKTTRRVLIDVGPNDKVLTYARFNDQRPTERHFQMRDPILIAYVKSLLDKLRK